jgi:chemotaxis protein MotB
MKGPHPLRQLEELDDELESRSGYTGTARWMIPYADFLTLLLGFFIILFAMVQLDNQKLAQSAKKAVHELELSQSRVEELEKRLDIVAEKPEPQEEPEAFLMEALDLGPEEQAANTSADAMQHLESSLAKELKLSGQEVTVRQDPRGLILSFQEGIFFGPGRADFTPEAAKTLDKLSHVLVKSHHPIRVEGHTDNTPIKTAVFPSNWELSTSRATSIVRYFVEKHHFPPERLSAAGYGEFHPLSNNSTIEGKQKNRRVDIVLLNPLSGLPAPETAKGGAPKIPMGME